MQINTSYNKGKMLLLDEWMLHRIAVYTLSYELPDPDTYPYNMKIASLL